jgi:hypothetical protein
MHYTQLKILLGNKDAIFRGYNSADGTTNDISTDAVITKDPNNYLVPTVTTSYNTVKTIAAIVGILAIIILLPAAIKTVKQFI